MPEILKISGLGPIKNLKIEVKPLTVLVGPQASGKSLAAQVLYFFRTLQSEFDQRYKRENTEEKGWQGKIIEEILNELRGTPFYYYTAKNTSIHYSDASNNIDWQIRCNVNGKVKLNSVLASQMQQWADTWNERASSKGISPFVNNVFIPTERAMISMFFKNEMGVVYRNYLPLPFRKFITILDYAERQYEKRFIGNNFNYHFNDKRDDLFIKLRDFQRNALKGELSYKRTGQNKGWEFGTHIIDKEMGNVSKMMPLSAITSGQMETWPFFAAASTAGVEFSDTSFIFEEPETHLHPAAQRIVVETIAYLVNQNRSFFITTHSPYVLYTINNLMQTFMSYSAFCQKYPPFRMGEARCGDHLGAEMPENHHLLDPKEVAAYRLTADGKAVSIIDKKTGLMDSDEVDATANQLGREFDALLDLEEGRG